MDVLELRAAMKKIGFQLSDVEVDTMAELMDDDKSGEIDFEEFYGWYTAEPESDDERVEGPDDESDDEERAEAEREAAAHRELQIAAANRRADSKLNHMIKGKCGGAKGFVEGVQLRLESPPEAVAQWLGRARGLLAEAADWCHKRELFVQLETGCST